MAIGKGFKMFNKKPDREMYFPESLFFAKENIYGSENKLYTLDEAQKKFEKGKQYSLEEIEKAFDKNYSRFKNFELEFFKSKFKYCSVGILSKNKGVIKLLIGLIVDSEWKRTGWYSGGRHVNGNFTYDNFTSDGFHLKKVEQFEKIHWLETNRLKGDYQEVRDTLTDLDLNITPEQLVILLGSSKGVSIKFQITEDIMAKNITIRYCYESVGGLSNINSVSLNAESFKNYMRHIYKERADTRMAICQHDSKCATKEEYIKFNSNQVGIAFTWYIRNNYLHELTLETYEDVLIRKIFGINASGLEEEIEIVFPMIANCYNELHKKFPEIMPSIRRIKSSLEIWKYDVNIDFGFEIVGKCDIHTNVFHTISYILTYLLNKHQLGGKYSYRWTTEKNTTLVGIERNY